MLYTTANKRLLAASAILAGLLGPTCSWAQEFKTHDDSELSRAIAEQFVRPMLTLPPEAAVEGDFEWLPLDVDGDDYDELFIKLKREGLCAVGGCPIVGFMRQPDESWAPILTAVGDALRMDEEHVLLRSEGKEQRYGFDADARALVPIADSITVEELATAT